MLTGIAGIFGVAAWNGSSPHPAGGLPPPSVPAVAEATAAHPVVLLTEAEPAAPRVTVSFNDEDNEAYALLRGVAPRAGSSSRPDLNVWYGPYSEHDYRPLPASPLEKEPSRLNVKVSIAF